MRLSEFKDALPYKFQFTCSACGSEQTASISQVVPRETGLVYKCENINCGHTFSLEAFKELLIDGKWKPTPPIKAVKVKDP